MSARRSSRLEREERTLAVMVGMYCRDHHQAGAGRAAPARNDAATDDDVRLPRRRRRVPIVRLCPDCDGLLVYAGRRLAACRYAAAKPTCVKCPTHCYKPEMRERVRAVMRYSGPRMLREHPVLAIAHLADGRRRAPGV